MNSTRFATATDGVAVRYITEDEFPRWKAAVQVGFLRPPADAADRMRHVPYSPGRLLGAFDGDRCVGTARGFPSAITVPGGAVLPADAIANVAVLPTHRRRGLLTRMMRRELAGAAERGEPVAILVAAEAGVYGRFGFGPATRLSGYRIAVPRAGGIRLPEAARRGRVELVDTETAARVGPGVHDAFRRRQPGAVPRPPAWWRTDTGVLRHPLRHTPEPFRAVYRDAGGTPTGLLTYRVEEAWEGGLPASRLVVLDLVTADWTASAALWHHCLSVDWVTTVVADNVAPDDPLPLLLGDPRAARATEVDCDFLWLRILDVPAALTARRYPVPGRVVIEVEDRSGHAAGRFALESPPDGAARCDRADGERADLRLDVSVLGSLYLGGETLARLEAAGLVEELRPGALGRADPLLRTPLRPWCPDGF
ncbi:GNAT family N-acetyltransferase [Allostreptomyces psammosilenae]|uniref:Putative acetyltransferase n=1 Tax=Allostreptomyces psammosilenae TaxID=1892865 RepID=A0A853A229_9ACTN|nr:GNAT family N-acetyltransferase [Allostreptomyces psammosilenae]NYI06944.1 putative acetyltransferase [Allostreptomyces psammosilenae]